MPLVRGDTFGRYIVEEALGAGGGGEVYRARDTVLNRAVALKFLLESTAGSDQGAVRARILREARAAAQLNHPNVVAIFDVGENEGVPYMAMELVPGRSLRAYVGAPGVPVDRRLRWLSDIAVALDAAHRSGLVHRDVKPENVIVRDDGLIKVVDFGIARQTIVDPHGPTAAENTGSATAGTAHYMAPEQIRNLPLDGRADQFGWGITAYELMSGGALPWDASGGALKYVAAVLGEDPIPLRERVGSLSPEVSIVIERAIRRNKEERFGTMEEVVRALDPDRSHAASDGVRHVVGAPMSDDVALQMTTKAPLGGERPEARGTAPWVRSRNAVAAVALLAVALISGTFVALRRHPNPPSDTHASLAPAPAPTSITGLPLPSTTDRAALAAYIEGMQALRDGAGYIALRKLQEAASHDQMLAEAYLRLALLFIEGDALKARDAYQRANELRSILSPRDVALLEAIEPMTNPSGKGAAEATRRLSALEKRYQADAEVAFDLQLMAGVDGQFSVARAAGLRALAIDPEFHAVLASLGEDEAYAGQFDEAMHTFERCLEKSGAATTCGFLSDLILEQRGECERLQHDARRLCTESPGAGPAYVDQANAMMARRAPPAAVRPLLEQQIALAPDDRREMAGSALNFLFDVAIGDFLAAENAARRYEHAIAANPSSDLHGLAASRTSDLYMETGRVKEAGAVARAMLEAKGGWAANGRVEDEGIANDATPFMLAAERAAGLLSESEFAAKRAAWLAEWETKAPAFFRGYLWVQAYAGTVTTRADALEALDALERYGGVPPFRPNTAVLIGRVYLLADRLDEAMPLLWADARRCDAVGRPFAYVQAQYWLGRGYEAKADVSSACTAYEDVLDRWGDARPRSSTADDARKRSQALHCARRAVAR
jgi:eukaryotic-like serine/threonine-protein kinase